MALTLRIPLNESSQVGEARRTARRCALNQGFTELEAEQVAIVVTEAATNILKHAVHGEILINRNAGGNGQADAGIEVLALDLGNGIANLKLCLQDGYSTAGSSGQGLGAIGRLSAMSDIYSSPGKGTLILARWVLPRNGSPSRDVGLETGAVNIAKPGQEVCGDAWGAVQRRDHTTLVVADGLGHGLEASIPSQEAIRVLREQPDLEPKALLTMMHGALRSTRGAAVAVARIDTVGRKLTFAGAGNIAAHLYSGSKLNQHLVSVNGTAGHQIQQIRQFSYPWPENGMLILHSDGLASGTSLESHAAAVLHDPSLIAALLYRDFCRGTDDATVLVTRGRS
jgi:anti-sigma regulatory factor (Ser/Thr protein kinase)